MPIDFNCIHAFDFRERRTCPKSSKGEQRCDREQNNEPILYRIHGASWSTLGLASLNRQSMQIDPDLLRSVEINALALPGLLFANS
jgi:hypothetical protein